MGRDCPKLFPANLQSRLPFYFTRASLANQLRSFAGSQRFYSPHLFFSGSLVFNPSKVENPCQQRITTRLKLKFRPNLKSLFYSGACVLLDWKSPLPRRNSLQVRILALTTKL